MHKLTITHWDALKRVLRYLNGTMSHRILLHSNSPLNLHAFSDSNWVGNKDDRTSTGAFIVFLDHNPISWSSKKPRSVAHSSTETEYRSVASTTAELCWLKSLLHELSISFPSAPTIYCDNIGATYLCANPVFHSRMKHISIDYHFVRDHVQHDSLKVSHVSSQD